MKTCRSEIFGLNQLSEANYQDKAEADQIFEGLLAESEAAYSFAREVVESTVHKDLNRYRYIHYEGKAWSHGKVEKDKLQINKELSLEGMDGCEVKVLNPGKTHCSTVVTKCHPAKTSLAKTLSEAQDLEVILGARALQDQAYSNKHDELKALINTFGTFLNDFRKKIHDCQALPQETTEEKYQEEAEGLEEMFKKSVVHNNGMKLNLKNMKKTL